MVRTLGIIAVAASGISACDGTSLVKSSQSTTANTATGSSSSDRAKYLTALRREQAKLAAAERVIPRRPRTPAQLWRSIRLLALAIHRLAADLAVLGPPAEVAAKHAQLVSIVRLYAMRLDRASRVAIRPAAQLQAGNMLLSATTAASSDFTSTVSAIDATLGQ